jgi:hypothetical protein
MILSDNSTFPDSLSLSPLAGLGILKSRGCGGWGTDWAVGV